MVHSRYDLCSCIVLWLHRWSIRLSVLNIFLHYTKGHVKGANAISNEKFLLDLPADFRISLPLSKYIRFCGLNQTMFPSSEAVFITNLKANPSLLSLWQFLRQDCMLLNYPTIFYQLPNAC